MDVLHDKENLAPALDVEGQQAQRPTSKGAKKGRSKSIGPGGLDEIKSDNGSAKQEAKDARNRRKSAFAPAVKSILPTKEDEAKRKAERRKSLANRRVSFAPEATLHTWDVIEYMRDHTTSTQASESTRRGSGINHSSPRQSSDDHSGEDEHRPDDVENSDHAEDDFLSPERRHDKHEHIHGTASGIPSVNFNHGEDVSSPSAFGGSSDIDGASDSGSEGFSDVDATGTAMSLDADEATQHTSGSGSSTNSSGRLEAALRQASEAAGTKGIEYDEFGEMSMELVGDETTNGFQPWAVRGDNPSDDEDQTHKVHDFDTFSPHREINSASLTRQQPPDEQDEEDGDMSMDVTRVVGGILGPEPPSDSESNEDGDTMEFTQAVGKVLQNQERVGQKRRRSTSEAGSPTMRDITSSKRKKSSMGRFSTDGDATMDLTVAAGRITSNSQPQRPSRRQSAIRRRTSAAASDAEDATMEFTTAIGGILPAGRLSDHSFDEGFSMELTTALGSIKEAVEASFEDRSEVPSGSPSHVTDDTDLPSNDKVPLETTIGGSGSPRLDQALGDHHDDVTPEPVKETSVEHEAVAYPELPLLESAPTVETPDEDKALIPKAGTTVQSLIEVPDVQPDARQDSSPTKVATPQDQAPIRITPQKPASDLPSAQTPMTPQQTTPQALKSPSRDVPTMSDSIRLLSTPRKETLRSVAPRKQSPLQERNQRISLTPKSRTPRTSTNKLDRAIQPFGPEDVEVKPAVIPTRKIHLQEFLDAAGVRFLDLTTSKRRMTAIHTPAKGKDGKESDDEEGPSLENAVVAGACTTPELEMFSHACRELKRYVEDGRADMKQLEQDTYNETPSLIQAYMNAQPEEKETIDSQLREIKSNARYQSKEVWYGWRSQLMQDLMKGLQGLGENLIKDDETLQRAEETIARTLPRLQQEHERVVAEAEELERTVAATSEEEKVELDGARERLEQVNNDLAEKREILETLQRQVQEQENQAETLQEVKTECTQAIAEAERVKEACRGVSLMEITRLKDSVDELEGQHGWKILSATSSPPSITMAYKQDLHLSFQPGAFQNIANSEAPAQPNAPISLLHNRKATKTQLESQTTIFRFFLQLLRATILALPQHATRIPDMLSFVRNGWDTALSVVEAERKLSLEGVTEARILNDDRLCISSPILLPRVRTKVRVTFDLVASVDESLDVSTSVEASSTVVYGEAYDGKKLTDFVIERIDGINGWDTAIRELREKLVVQGAKGKRV